VVSVAYDGEKTVETIDLEVTANIPIVGGKLASIITPLRGSDRGRVRRRESLADRRALTHPSCSALVHRPARTYRGRPAQRPQR
jgi:hypothetical protein